MLDAVTFEKLGIPTIPITTASYEKSARRWAELQGLPDLRHAVVHSDHGQMGSMNADLIEQVADDVVAQVVDGVMAKRAQAKA